jgi:hypothetical protein
MRANIFERCCNVRAVLPYLWGFAAAAALDYVVDVQTLFLPVMAGVAVVSTTSLVLQRTGR